MIKTKRALKGLVFGTVLALSLVATSAPAFAAQHTTNDSTLVSRDKGSGRASANDRGGVTGLGVTWEGSFTALGISWE